MKQRKYAVRIGATWYETEIHEEVKGVLHYVLHDATRGSAGAGDWKPLEQAKLQYEVKKKRR